MVCIDIHIVEIDFKVYIQCELRVLSIAYTVQHVVVRDILYHISFTPRSSILGAAMSYYSIVKAAREAKVAQYSLCSP